MPVTFPSETDLDGAGVVDEVGRGVTDVTVGDAVFGSGLATVAQYAVLKDWTAKPTEPSFLKAAGYPIPVETALRILDQMDVQSGQTLLVSGASGGVGLRSPAIRPCSRHPVIDTAGPAN